MVKRYISLLIRRFLFQYLRISQKREISKLIFFLKNEGKYSRYPFDKFPPVMAKYSYFKKSDIKWLNFYYSIFGKPDQKFVSVPVYYYIETCMNPRLLVNAIKEKNFYNKFLKEISTPTTFLRRINGFYYNDKFQRVERRNILNLISEHQKIIIKGSIRGGGGNFIDVFEKNNDKFTNGDITMNTQYLDNFSNDFIVQEFITQHSFFSQFNPICNNTIKVFIYRSIKDDSINLLHSIFMVGAKGHYLDHDQHGGVVLSIDEENRFNAYAMDIYGRKNTEINNIMISKLEKVPAMNELRDLAIKIASNIYYARLLALDFTINKDGKPLLLEINCFRNGINQYQMHNGGLFKQFTEEIMEYCEKNPPRYVVTF